ncbi:MAG TPA: M12 family metallopeptidase, partial [Gammaproteobacteria bacterium]|nr:M12 family metallopeptidase [Gammaproteobacteria bacterium]
MKTTNQLTNLGFFDSQKTNLLKIWQINDKEVQLIINQDGQLTANIKISTDEDQSIETDNIEGIPEDILSNTIALREFLKKSHMRLSFLSDGDYKLYISSGLDGGGNIIDLLGEYKSAKFLWPNAIVPYAIDNRNLTRDQIQIIQMAISEWNAVTSETGFQLIAKNTLSTDYVNHVEFTWNTAASNTCMKINNNQPCNFCESPVGRQSSQGGKQLINCNVGRNGENTGFDVESVMHEIGHAIGLYHEHQRLDRD